MLECSQRYIDGIRTILDRFQRAYSFTVYDNDNKHPTFQWYFSSVSKYTTISNRASI